MPSGEFRSCRRTIDSCVVPSCEFCCCRGGSASATGPDLNYRASSVIKPGGPASATGTELNYRASSVIKPGGSASAAGPELNYRASSVIKPSGSACATGPELNYRASSVIKPGGLTITIERLFLRVPRPPGLIAALRA